MQVRSPSLIGAINPLKMSFSSSKGQNFRQSCLDPVRKFRDFSGGFLPERRETVFDMGRHDIECHATHQAVSFEPLQCLSKHTFTDATNLTTQFTETTRPVLQHDQDQHPPAARDMLQHLTRGALSNQQITATKLDRERLSGLFRMIFYTYMFVRTYEK